MLIWWMAISNLTLVTFRLLHFMGQSLSGIQEPPVLPENEEEQQLSVHSLSAFRWEKVPKLRRISCAILYFIFPFFIAWTLAGNIWVVESERKCVSIHCF